MSMSKEMERLKSKMEFYERLINEVFDSYKYDKKIEEYEKELLEVYKRIQELKEEENKWMSK